MNLLASSPTFVLRESGDQGEMDVLNPNQIADDSGIYWIHGLTLLPSGKRILSVFRVDTGAGGALCGVFWHDGANWFSHDEEDALAALKVAGEQITPFDWKLSVPLERDTFH
ncbi:hypothetical protein FYZ48_06275 [Gimesia chilikensis]|uniref:hypothetical protein n=1 Tax=Gimesia chilikensis TaxID=2605989 RepID=UPI0011EE947F|nr:hypothetical protein [Gimesia chilikensis]KAA0140875.1 hypothetical protein FYZ48_06275 [Gimesia chilikensis]